MSIQFAIPDNDPVPESQPLREQLRQWRMLHNLSQQQVSSLLGITQTALSAFERGRNRDLRPATSARLRSLLGLSNITEFIARENAMMSNNSVVTQLTTAETEANSYPRLFDFDAKEDASLTKQESSSLATGKVKTHTPDLIRQQRLQALAHHELLDPKTDAVDRISDADLGYLFAMWDLHRQNDFRGLWMERVKQIPEISPEVASSFSPKIAFLAYCEIERIQDNSAEGLRKLMESRRPAANVTEYRYPLVILIKQYCDDFLAKGSAFWNRNSTNLS